MFQATKVPNDQSSKRPMFQSINVPSYHATERPCNKSKNRGARNKVREPKNENRRTKSSERNLWNKILGTKTLERKILKFCASWVGKLTRNPTFGISFCFAVKGKQVVLLWVQKFLPSAAHRSGQDRFFALRKLYIKLN